MFGYEKGAFTGAAGTKVGLFESVAATLLAMTCIGIPFAIYIGLGWALVLPLIMIEGLGMSAAMGRSWGLVKGHRWRLLVALVLIGLIMYLLVSIPSGIFGFVGGIANAILQAGTTGALVVQAGNAVFGALGETLFGAIAYIAITLFYYDLRIRKEAFDLQQRAQYADLSAGAGAPGAPTYPAQTGYTDQPPDPGQEDRPPRRRRPVRSFRRRRWLPRISSEGSRRGRARAGAAVCDRCDGDDGAGVGVWCPKIVGG